MILAYINLGLSSVFESQVLGFLIYLQNRSEFRQVVMFCGYRDKMEREKIFKITRGSGLKVQYFKYYPNYPVFNKLNAFSILRTLIKAGLSKDKDTTFHIRGELATYHTVAALKLLNIPCNNILADIRGAGVEEIEEFRGGSKIIKEWKIRNYIKALQSLKSLNYISVVSESLKTYMVAKFSLSNSNIYIVPCLTGSQFTFNNNLRERLRSQMNIKHNELLFVFSSKGEAIWQNSSMMESLNIDGFKVLNLSSRKLENINIINRYIPYNKMPSYLSAADAGIIFRNNSTVNKVASPVKFSEYVCMGLPVISNKNVDVIKDYVETTGNGLILNHIEDLTNDDLNYLRSIARNKIIEEGNSRFSIENVADKYLSIYRKMNTNL